MIKGKAIKILENLRTYAFGDDLEALDMAIEALSGGRHGKWIDDEPNIDDWSYKKGNMPRYCSACGHRAGKFKYKTYKFCPWCGADMRGEQE